MPDRIFFLEPSQSDGSTITLKDKPLRIIQSAIKGKWKLAYSRGGICGTCVYSSSLHIVMDLTTRDVIKLYQGDLLVVDTLMIWKKVRDISNSATYQLFYSDRRGNPIRVKLLLRMSGRLHSGITDYWRNVNESINK